MQQSSLSTARPGMSSLLPAAKRLDPDIAAIARIGAVPTILKVISEATGMRLALVARVTPDAWTACAVVDRMNFGLAVGDHLDVATTLCSVVRDSHQPVIIEHAANEPAYCDHPTPKMYGFESYIAVPIIRPNGEYFGNVCALDPRPAVLRDAKTLAMVQLFAELIALQLTAEEAAGEDRAALTDARETADLREQFIAVLGHDLRNPVSAIAAGSAFLLDLPQDDTQRTILGRIRSSADRMARMIDDVMDFARGRLGGGMQIARESIDVADLVQHVATEIASAHPTCAIHVAATHAGSATLDRGRIAQMLSNLVANAVEHGSPGEPIEVRADRSAAGVRFAVVSRGRPIPADVLRRLFQPYFRGGDERARPGLGLGLYIAAEIARAHGGTITADSSPDGVTTFAIDLPDA